MLRKIFCLLCSSNSFNLKKLSRHSFFLLIALLSFSACENDIEKINALTSNTVYPAVTGYDFKTVFSDSSLIQVVLEAKELQYYQDVEEPYYEFPQGFILYLYDENEVRNYMITAEYGIAYTEKQLWVGRNNVVIKNLLTPQQLNTEELFWDQKTKTIYSEKFTKITDKGDTHIGENGFKANQDFSKYQLIGGKGNFHVKED